MPSLADYVDRLLAEHVSSDTPGCALAIVDHGEIILSRGYGLADLERQATITPTTQFHLASTSKQFTAMCIALLAAEGRLALDDDLRAYVPELPPYERPITIRNLLHHTSGLRECLTLWAITGHDFMRLAPQRDVLDLLARQRELNFGPGDRFEYNNSNYLLLALIVERVSGQTLEAFAAEQIFQPLRMHHSAFHDDPGAIIGSQAYGYLSTAAGFARAPEGIGAFGAAGVFSTVKDLVRWDENFNHPIVGDAATIAQMLTPGRVASGRSIRYGFGLFIQNYKGLPIVSHGGMFPGISTQIMRFPEQQFSVICLANTTAINPSVIAFHVAERHLNHPLLPRHVSAAGSGKQPDVDLNAYTGTFHNTSSGKICDVVIEAGQLVVQMKETRLSLDPISATQFQVTAASDPTVVTFEFTSAGPLLHIDPIIEGELSMYVAVERLAPSADELDAFVGSYYSNDLDVAFEFIHQGDQLILAGLNFPLEPTIRDCFRSDLGMHFECSRDDQGHVAGFTFFCNGANRVRFMRKGSSN